MTSLPARRLKLADRGTIRTGMKADLVLFDPKTVIDRSTFEKPKELAEGIRMVFVNGEAVWEDGKGDGSPPRTRPRRGGAAPADAESAPTGN
jgi:N-acyl-D-amino-acid deacylase